MSRTLSKRLLALSPLTLISDLVPACRLPKLCLRSFSHTTLRKDDQSNTTASSRGSASSLQSRRVYPREFPSAPLSTSLHPKAARSEGSKANNTMAHLTDLMSRNAVDRRQQVQNRTRLYNTRESSDGSAVAHLGPAAPIESHHFHIYATRHNTHITLTDTNRNPIISLSCGNIGFKHSARKHYDSAFQLAGLVLAKMQDRGINNQIKQVEVVLRGFGAGREAVTKALLGLEGKHVRHKIIKVADATRLKFGGTRSKKPRRLG